jgi:hypothetical protein
MKLVSTLTLGVMLALGSAGMLASSPAVAKKETPAKPVDLKLSKEFRALIVPAQAAVKDSKFDDAKAKLAAADAIAATPDEKYFAGIIRLQLATALKDQTMQAKAVNMVIASGATPAADLPKFNFFAGEFAYAAGDFKNAIYFLKEAERLGYQGTDLYLRLAETNFKTPATVQAGFTYLDRAIASETTAGRKAPESWYARAASVAYKAKLSPDIAKYTRAQVQAYPTVENWRSALVVYRDSTKLDGQLQLDLARLMHDTKSLAGERDYYDYAALATERALPGEAKSVIEEGYALGSVSKTSAPVRERLAEATGKIAADRASVAADEKRAANAADGKLAANTAGAFLAYADYPKAISLYQLALKKGGVDMDTVNTRLGIALTRSGQKAEARKSFAAVGGARTEIARFWTLYLDLNP